ncbi:CpaF family protein [Eggerthellaceae bacterium zg-887]|nr:CpaF family protein [Xiamenia xianingshaonis]
MRENPQRARNELKSACRQVFENSAWSIVSEGHRADLVERLIDEVFGMGPLEALLADDEVTEIMVNGPESVYFERNGRIVRSGRSFSDEASLRSLIDRILGPIGRRVDESSPLVNARLSAGHRVNVVIPPLSLDGPILTIRKFSEQVLTLDSLESFGSFDRTMKRFLVWCVLARKSVAVSGGTGSGKTTLLNALSCELPKHERIITIEDSAELRFLEHPHVVRLEARPRNAEGKGEVTIRDLVINALRMRPDRIVVGECRGAEALDMLQAMNTGHDGSLTTLHSNSSSDAVSRLVTMVRYAVDLPVDVIEANIASAFDVVVQTARFMDGRRYVSEVAEFTFDREKRLCETKTLFERATPDRRGEWRQEPEWLDEIEMLGIAGRDEVDEWRRQAFCA